jgi:hypothetical protein
LLALRNLRLPLAQPGFEQAQTCLFGSGELRFEFEVFRAGGDGNHAGHEWTVAPRTNDVNFSFFLLTHGSFQCTGSLMRNHEERIAELEGEIKSLRKIGRTKRNPVKGIGGNIQRLREEQLVGLKELAKLAGVSAGLVCKIETTPDANVELHTILRLACALRVEPAALIQNGTTKPKRKTK